mgnify:CR=1 FL=1
MADKDTQAGAAAEVEKQQQLPQTDGEELSEIEVELDGEGDGEAAPAAAAGEAAPNGADAGEGEGDAPKPKKKRATETISRLKNENQQITSYAARMEQELAELRQRAQSLEAKSIENERVGMEQYSARLKSDLASAEARLQKAHEEQDVKAISSATADVAKASAALADVEAWQTDFKNRQEAVKQKQAQQTTERPQTQQKAATLSEATRAWIDQNDWFNPQSENFDDAAHIAVAGYASSLEGKIARGLLNYKVESQQYWDAINEFVAKRFPEHASGYADDDEEDEPVQPTRRVPQMSKGGSPVAAVRGQQAIPGQTKQSADKVKLTSEEHGLVKQMVGNGAMLYPKGHPKFGQRMDMTDALKTFARQKQLNPPRNPR